MVEQITAEAARSYAAALPIPSAGSLELSAAFEASAVDIENLPTGVVAGSNAIAFDNSLGPKIRSSVADSLLLAQLATDNSPIVQTPEKWYSDYCYILNRLGWRETAFSTVHETITSRNIEVHKAIIPFLEAAFGPAAAVGSLIITALTQLSEMDKEKPCITLFERESKRLGVSDYQFTAVTRDGLDTTAHLVGTTLSAAYGRTQVLFFKITSTSASFDMVKGTLSVSSNLLEVMDKDLKIKLRQHIPTFIRELDIGAPGGG